MDDLKNKHRLCLVNKNVLVCDPRYVLNLSHSVIIRSLTFGSSKTMGLANFVEFHGLPVSFI